MNDLSQTYHIAAPIEKVWQALVDSDQITQWSDAPAEMSTRLESFSLWDGEIHGKNLEVVPNEKLVQEWYGWDEQLGASRVVITLTTEGKETVLELTHTHIPDAEYEEVESGWRNFYLEPMIEWVESR